MNSTSNSIMSLNSLITTHDDFEGDKRLIIDEDDRNNNDKCKLLNSSGNSTRSNSPLHMTKSVTIMKIKTKKQLETSRKIDEKLSNLVCGFSGESQLRRALEKGPQKEVSMVCSSTSVPSASTTMSLSSTPLLAASLSRPPVASPSSSLSTLASAAVAASATSSTMNINNSAVDLSQRKNMNSQIYKNGPNESFSFNNDINPSSNVYEPYSAIKDKHKSPLRSPSEVYANLLMQLRHAQARINNGSRSLSPLASVQQVQDQNVQDCNPNSPSNITSYNKLTAAARKEKLRLQTSFQCPVCKKRFQRHIALNAHFQNEHIGSTSSEKHCKLCTYICPDITSIRAHLLAKHCIDLDSPSSCRVDGEEGNLSELLNTSKQTSNSSPPSPSSSSSPSHFSNNADNVDQCYKSKRSTRGKSKGRNGNNLSHTYQDERKDLKDRSLTNSPNLKESGRVVFPDTVSYDESSSSSLASNGSSCISSAVDAISSSSIQHSSTLSHTGISSRSSNDKASSSYIKQEPNEDNIDSHDIEQNRNEQATDLSIKKSSQENRPSSSTKRKSTSTIHKAVSASENCLLDADINIPSVPKKLKSEIPTFEEPVIKSLTNNSESSKITDVFDDSVFQLKCQHCSILFPNQTLYFLHRGFHSEGSNPWRCNGCGRCCTDMYDFNTHLMSDSHS